MNVAPEYTIPNLTLSSAAADRILTAAIKCAKEIGLNASICILDASGRMKAFHSMDAAPAISHETAGKKAKMALGFGMPTGETWLRFIENDPILRQGASQLPDFILLGGGSPIHWKGSLIGAVGVSGGHYKQDEQIVAAGLAALL
jgi:uncharacterized protein GlcG (DUF336 family)